MDGPDAGLTGARVLRYDTTSTAFDDDAARTSYDMEGPLGVNGGHIAAVLDGKYLVIGPRDDSNFIRFDTSLAPTEFGFDTSWEVFDASGLGATETGFTAALPVDGGALFTNAGHLTPMEHQGDAFDAGWQVAQLDAGVFGCANTHGGICAGGQLFFGPAGGNASSCLARFDPSVAPFGTNAGWDSVDLATLADENGFLSGMVADNQHMYVTQYSTHDAAAPVQILRRPFAGNLDAGWEAQPTNVKNPLTRGFVGGAFDGRYVYFAPYPTPSTTVIFSRYDTTLAFGDETAWTIAAGDALAIPSNRFWGAVFDGQYVYFPSNTPLNGETPTFARFKAYDTKIAVPGPAVANERTRSGISRARSGLDDVARARLVREREVFVGLHPLQHVAVVALARRTPRDLFPLPEQEIDPDVGHFSEMRAVFGGEAIRRPNRGR